MKSSINSDHLSHELILRVLDDEVTPAQRLECEAHLSCCEFCQEALASLQGFSLEIDQSVHSLSIPDMAAVRRDIQNEIESRSVGAPMVHHPGRVMRRFGWGMGIAATLAFGVLLAPRHEGVPETVSKVVPMVGAAQTPSIEVDGESFLPVPYANADLSTTAPHIVQMEVPVSSLSEIGIVYEPITNRVSDAPEAERSVLADVLMGADGQPRGVHIVGYE